MARADFHHRARIALQFMLASPLPARVKAEVDAFFAQYRDIERNSVTEAFITSLVLEKFSTAADSQSEAQPQTEAKKVA
jgi:hypothetical protein